MTDAGRPLALAALVLLAGCGGFAGQRSTAPTTTVTPAPVPTTTPTPTATPERVAPGVTGAGVIPSALARAHVARLRNASFSLLYNRTVLANGSVRHRQVTTGEFGAGYRRYRVVVTRSGEAVPDSRTQYRYDGRRVTRVTTRGNDSTTTVVMDTRAREAPRAAAVAVLPFAPAFGDRIEGVLSAAGTVDVDPQAPHNVFAGELSRVRATDFRSGSPAPGVRTGRLRALVDPDGFVRVFELRYETVRNGTRVTVVERVRYAVVDETGEPTATRGERP